MKIVLPPMKKHFYLILTGLLLLSPLTGQNVFKINQYNIYYNHTFMPVGTLFANHQFSSKWSIASYFYVNATAVKAEDVGSNKDKPSWGEGLAGPTFTPVPGFTIGILGGFQSNEGQAFRISPIILINKNRFSLFGAFEFGGARTRWDAMGFYSIKSLKLGAELIRYYTMYAAGPRVEFSFIKKQPVTVFYSALWDWKGTKLASMFGIYSSFAGVRQAD